jgi:hypothetical protein
VFLVVLHRRKKNLEGLLAFFFLRNLFIIVTKCGKTLLKILGFNFLVLFFGYPVPSFAVKSYFCIYVGTTQPVILPVTPQHGPSTVFMCSIGCDPYGDSILLITLSISSPKVAKNDKNAVFFTFFQNHCCTKL